MFRFSNNLCCHLCSSRSCAQPNLGVRPFITSLCKSFLLTMTEQIHHFASNNKNQGPNCRGLTGAVLPSLLHVLDQSHHSHHHLFNSQAFFEEDTPKFAAWLEQQLVCHSDPLHHLTLVRFIACTLYHCLQLFQSTPSMTPSDAAPAMARPTSRSITVTTTYIPADRNRDFRERERVRPPNHRRFVFWH